MATSTAEAKHGEVQDFKADVAPAGGPNQLGWGVWPLWVAACVAGNAGGALAFAPTAHIAPDAPEFLRTIANWAPVLFAATFPGLLQWLIFRRWFSGAGWWILATGVGSLLGFWGLIGGGIAEDTGGGRFAVWSSFTLGGVGLGAVEWLVLRRWSARSGVLVLVCWVLARTIGWLGATWVFTSLSKAAEGWAGGLLGGAACGALSGAITGLALVWLMRYTKVNQSSASVVARRA